MEQFDEHRDGAKRRLTLIECDTFSDVMAAIETPPGKRFATLLVADFLAATADGLVILARRLIDLGARYLCAWGPGCQSAHDSFDIACCEFEMNSESVILTTDHSNETLAKAVWFALECTDPVPPYKFDSIVAICVNDKNAGSIIRNAFRDPVAFAERYGPSVDDEE